MDKRLNEISFQLSEYSLGNFEKRLAISQNQDEVDAIISGINMLGEELESITISRNYFTNIFNSVSDMVFILNQKGEIKNVNRSAEKELNYEPGSLFGKSITDLKRRGHSFFRNILKQLKENRTVLINESVLLTKSGVDIPVEINVSHFKDGMKNQFIILSASNITYRIKNENRIIRTIINSQEKERQRFSQDLHDGILQQLSGIKFNISSMANLEKNEKKKSILLQSNDDLSHLIVEMRNTCFDLMPGTLKEFGFIKAIKEYANHIFHDKKIKLVIEENNRLPELSHEIKIDLYRVIQEFINNATNHGNATKIKITFSSNKKKLKLNLVDNGKGFELKETFDGMGLQSVQSRVKSHNGSIKMISNIGKGTSYIIMIPLKTELWED